MWHDGRRRGRRMGPVGLALLAGCTMLLAWTLAACQRSATPRPPAPTALPGAPRANLPDRQTNLVIRPETGGTLLLSDGAEAAVPPHALSGKAVATFRKETRPPTAPLPRSIVGQAHDLALDGADLTGVVRLALPLPAAVEPEQYDLAPYRWNGQAWERLGGRVDGSNVRFGSDKPGLFAVLGEWRMADVTATLTVAQASPDRPVAVAQVSGEYRYRSLPAAQHDYTQAHLLLKRDTSGGAGQVSGNETLDQTVEEAVLWFKPDTSRVEGRIPFTHTFDLPPDRLAVGLGQTANLYTVITVDDSPAPTRRLSSAAEYVQMVNISVIGTDVVRPSLPVTAEQTLRWHVRLNGTDLFTRPANDVKLSLAEALAMGGLGEYKITLEGEVGGQYAAVSNEVTVQLTVPDTPTPMPSATTAAASEGPATPTRRPTPPFGPMPATPTQRSRPGQPELTVTPTITETTPTPTITPTATRPPWASTFWADSYQVASGACTTLHWHVQNITGVWIENAPTVGDRDDYQVCPTVTTIYTLRTTDQAGQTQNYHVTIAVDTTTGNANSSIEFWADPFMINEGGSTTLHWRTSGVSGVYFNGEGVVGEGARTVSPTADTTYELKVEIGSQTVIRKVTVYVAPANAILMRFWAEQYALPANTCTRLHWSVQNVQGVYLNVGNGDEGVTGDGARDNVCPNGAVTYRLKAIAADSQTKTVTVTLQSPPAALPDRQVIAQGIIKDITFQADVQDAVGEQPGWRILIDGVNRLFKGTGDCCDQAVTLTVTQQQVAWHPGAIDWPLRAGQAVEFDAACDNRTQCRFDELSGHTYYLKQVSP